VCLRPARGQLRGVRTIADHAGPLSETSPMRRFHVITGTINVGNDGPNSGDGNEPTRIVLTMTPTPTGS